MPNASHRDVGFASRGASIPLPRDALFALSVLAGRRADRRPTVPSDGDFGGLLVSVSSQSDGGRGVRPSMMSFSCSSSIVSYLMSASAITCSLSSVDRRGSAFARLKLVSITRAHFLIDRVRRAIRHLLVLRDAAAEEHFAVSSE